MKLVDMKNDAEDYQDGTSMLGYADSSEQPVYPWNMRASLTDRDSGINKVASPKLELDGTYWTLAGDEFIAANMNINGGVIS